MNIFYIDRNPISAAMAHVDKHVVKMPIELGQMLSTAHHVIDGKDAVKGIYKPAFENHPCSLWVRENRENYSWTFMLFVELLEEYSFRYKRRHSCDKLIAPLFHAPNGLKQGRMTQPAQAMPDNFKSPDSLIAYRNYYRDGKAHIHRWTERNPPKWL